MSLLETQHTILYYMQVKRL